MSKKSQARLLMRPTSDILVLETTVVPTLVNNRSTPKGRRSLRVTVEGRGGYVFTAVDGGVLAPERLSRLFRKLNTASGLPPVRLHDLRHGAATLTLAAGVELKVV